MSGNSSSSAGATAPQGSLYFPTLDGLRLCAFLLVFVHHLPKPTHPVLTYLHDGGWVGVSIFLALSAYLLTSILALEYERTGTISVKKFFIRRSLRIWPLYFAFVTALGAYAVHRLGATREVMFRFGGLVFFIDNVLTGLRGYNPISYTNHLWTVGLEEQFYLVLPFALALWLRRSGAAQRNVLVIWGAFVAGRIVCAVFRVAHPFVWTSILSCDPIVIGIWLGLGRWKAPTTAGGRALLAIGGLGMVLSSGVLDIYTPGPTQVAGYAIIGVGAGLTCMAALHEPWLAFLGLKPLRYLGKISYGLYVFHLVGIGVVETLARRAHLPWSVKSLASLFITLALAAASYELLEKPFLRLKSRFETIRTRAV